MTPPGDAVSSEPIDRARLAETSLYLASDEHCGELSRITAITVCGRLGIIEALPVVTELAQTADSIPLRIAAIATIGYVGNPQDESLLAQLAQDTDRIGRAAKLALSRQSISLQTQHSAMRTQSQQR